MHGVARETPNGITAMKQLNPEIYALYIKNPIIKSIMNHPKVSECGHTGNTMNWTVHKLSHIYRLIDLFS